MIDRLVIFGATGDLMSRKLLPALIQLGEAGRLPHDFRIIGVGRKQMDTEIFMQFVRESLTRHGIGVSASERLLSSLEYRRADVANPEQVASALQSLCQEALIAYLALPPSLFPAAVKALSSLGLHDGSRVVVEKPFGNDFESARSINQLLRATFSEQSIFRIDHFLHKQTVQNVLGLRFANRAFEYLWNRDHIELFCNLRAVNRNWPAHELPLFSGYCTDSRRSNHDPIFARPVQNTHGGTSWIVCVNVSADAPHHGTHRTGPHSL